MSGNRNLGRTSSQRKAMLRGMVTYLFENGKVETTYTRAKEVAATGVTAISLGCLTHSAGSVDLSLEWRTV